jgi:predicted transcriptional regulator
MMNNEELERKMAFIVEQQAHFASDIQKMRELQAQTEDVVGRLAQATLEGFRDVNTKIDSLVDSQIKLTEAQTQTDENLRNLIAVVDRYFSEGRNGK